MHILQRSTTRLLFFAAFAAALVLGVLLTIQTFNNLTRQRALIQRHILLAAEAIGGGIEGALRAGGMGRGRRAAEVDLREILQELARGDISLIQIFLPDGTMLAGTDDTPYPLPEEAWQNLAEHGSWYRLLREEQSDRLVYFTRPKRPPQRPAHMMPRRPQPGALLFVLDVTPHFALYRDYRAAALWQTLFIFGAMLALFTLGAAFLRRRDLSRRAMELESFQADLLDTLPEGVVLLDADQMIRAANPAFHDILGLEPDALLGRPWNELRALQDGRLLPEAEDTKAAWKQCRLGDLHLEILVKPLNDPARQSLVVLRDRTGLKRMEKELQDAERLASIGHLAAGLAHEIRNPLSALRGFAQFFAKRLAGKEPEEKYAQAMVEESDRLNRVLTDLLTLAQPGRARLEKTSLRDLVKDVRNIVQLDLDHRGIGLEVRLEREQVLADPAAARQVLLNLLLNALDVVPDHTGRIVVAGGGPDDAPWIEVRDNGPGIPETDRSRVFDAFYTTRPTGTGLGLAMVRKLMRDQGGDVEALSAEEGGARLRLSFPPLPGENTP